MLTGYLIRHSHETNILKKLEKWKDQYPTRNDTHLILLVLSNYLVRKAKLAKDTANRTVTE